ncbi:MAG TPA: MFS transporter [Myxococcaceae bacterium]|nr:MFS transporter [Myxococcaceae bacterium]
MGNLLRRIVDVRRAEVAALLWSSAYFFVLLGGYYILRPVRDQMGISRGAEKLPVLFTGTFVAMLVASPLFGALASRWPRQKLIPWVYHFFALNLVAFVALWKVELGRGWVPFAFYIWAAVYNVFVVSVFWSLMTDLFSEEQGKRLFGFIAAGGTLGGLVGPTAATLLAAPVGPINLLLLSAVLLEIAVLCVWMLVRWARVNPVERAGRRDVEAEAAIGGSVWSGLKPVAASPFLLASAGYVVLATVGQGFLYLQQAKLIELASDDPAARTALFATIDLVVNVSTLVLQLVVTGRVLKRLGITVALSITPVLTGLGFAYLAMNPVVRAVAIFQGARRAAQHAIVRPARELLFTQVTREERYKSKNFIDTAVFRGGDMLTGWLYAGLGALGIGLVGIAWLSVPISAAWLALGVYLGREMQRRERENG